MKRLLGSTTALSMAMFNVQPWPLMAQTLNEDGYVLAADGTVLCEPTAELACDPANPEIVLKAQEIEAAMMAAQAEADAAAQAQAEADAAAQAQAEADAAAQAEADAAAKAEAVQPAEEVVPEVPAATEDATVEQPVDVPATEPPVVEEPSAETPSVDVPVVDPAVDSAVDPAEQEDGTAGEAAVDEATAEQPVVEEAPAAEATVDAPEVPAVTEEAVTDEVTTEEPVVETVVDPNTGETLVVDPNSGAAMTEEEVAAEAEAQAESLAEAQSEIVVQSDGTVVDPAKGLATAETEVDPDAVPVDAPVPTDTEVQTLTDLMAQPDTIDPKALGAAESLMAEPVPEGEKPSDLEPSPEAVATVTEMLTDIDTRSSTQEFAAAPVAVSKGKKDRLSDLEKVGLVALGALVVGAIINENNKAEQRQVVSNTGDRVVVLRPDGTYQVYKDDDAVIRRPGSTVRTETYKDGSTRTIIERVDGTQIVTIRDATGRVLRRAQYDDLGRELVLIDDLEPEEVVIVRDLPKPKHKHVVISTQDDDAVLRAEFAAKDIAKLGRKFSLRQIREIPEVRALAATIDVESITFDSGSAAIKASEASDLADLGALMQSMIDNNPREMFLIEGHTDATGKAAMNLALSDRRAESVALALTEYFDIPPENMVIQGFGETELRIDTQSDEKRNRRVAVRIITPLLKNGK